MSLIQHKITLDVKTFRSVEPIMMFTDSASAYSIIVKITDGGKEVDLSEYDTFKMEIEGTQTTNFPEGTVENNRIVFELSNTMINEGWTVCDVTMMSGSTLVKTQVFQIYKQIFNAVQVDETPFISMSQDEILHLRSVADSISNLTLSWLNQLTPEQMQNLLAQLTITSVSDYSAANNLVQTTDTTRQSGKTYYLADGTEFVGSNITGKYEKVGSGINNGTLRIVPKIQDIQINGSTKLSGKSGVTGVANIYSTDVVEKIQVFNFDGTEIDNGSILIDGTIYNVTIDPGVERVSLNGKVLEFDTYTDDYDGNYQISDITALEKIKLNGSVLPTTTENDYLLSNINAVTGVKVGNTNIDATNTNPRVELDSSDGVSLTPDTTNHKVTIGFDTSDPSFEVPIDRITAPNNTDDGSLAVYTNGHFEAQDWVSALNLSVTESGNNVSIRQGDRSVEIHNTDFTPVTSIADTSNMLFLTSNDSRQRISWANLMSLFEKYFMTRHKTVYFTKTIAGDSWSGDTATVTLGSSDFENTDITADDMVGNHTHAHIHPEPDSVYEFANYGIYCSAVNAENGNAVLTFKRNTTLDGSVMPLVRVTIEVRLDVEDT